MFDEEDIESFLPPSAAAVAPTWPGADIRMALQHVVGIFPGAADGTVHFAAYATPSGDSGLCISAESGREQAMFYLPHLEPVDGVLRASLRERASAASQERKRCI
jgi:hypothetical protein